LLLVAKKYDCMEMLAKARDEAFDLHWLAL
jgi:hypothetical protein